MPRVGLIVQTSVFRLFILDVGLHLLVGFVPEHQQTVGVGGGGHGEQDVIPLQVREGPVGNNKVIISSDRSKNWERRVCVFQEPVTDGDSAEVLSRRSQPHVSRVGLLGKHEHLTRQI